MKLINGDCLEEMKQIEDNSIDMILCDLPYGTLGNHPPSKWSTKDKIASWDIRLDTSELFNCYARVLRQNGKAILFCQGDYVAELINKQSNQLRFCQKAIWLKNKAGNILGCKSFLTNYFEDICIFQKPREEDKSNNYIVNKLLEQLERNNKTRQQAISLVGCTASHYFTNGKQFRLPTREKYSILKDNGFFDIEYDQLKNEYDEYLGKRFEYLDQKYPSVFNLWESGSKQKSNVFIYNKDTCNYHPTQKPLLLLEDIIKTFTNESDTILDNCMGSGSTGVACVNTNRDFIGIELDEGYFNIAKERIESITI